MVYRASKPVEPPTFARRLARKLSARATCRPLFHPLKYHKVFDSKSRCTSQAGKPEGCITLIAEAEAERSRAHLFNLLAISSTLAISSAVGGSRAWDVRGQLKEDRSGGTSSRSRCPRRQ